MVLILTLLIIPEKKNKTPETNHKTPHKTKSIIKNKPLLSKLGIENIAVKKMGEPIINNNFQKNDSVAFLSISFILFIFSCILLILKRLYHKPKTGGMAGLEFAPVVGVRHRINLC